MVGRVAIALLLLASPAGAQSVIADAVLTDVVIASQSLAPDESAAFLAWWSLDEASGTRAQDGGSCGTDCNLPENGTVGQDTSDIREGSAAADFDDNASNDLECEHATCDELSFTGSVTFGAWHQSDAVAANDSTFSNINVAGTGGFQLQRNDASARLNCVVYDAGGAVTASSADSSWPDDGTWVHTVCRFDDAADAIQAYINGATSGSSATQDSMAAPANGFTIGNNNAGNFPYDGRSDEVFIYVGVLDAAEICHICSCGISNHQSCTCSGASYASTGRNASACGSCTLPSNCSDPIQ